VHIYDFHTLDSQACQKYVKGLEVPGHLPRGADTGWSIRSTELTHTPDCLVDMWCREGSEANVGKGRKQERNEL